MKKAFMTFVLIHSISFLFSQNSVKQITNDEIRKVDKSSLVKNDPVIDATNWSKLNAIAQKTYSQDQASRMPNFKINQINYLYSSSYKIINSNGCKLDMNEINFQQALPKRAQTETIAVPMKTKDGCDFTMELLSIHQINKEFNKIESENK